MITGTSYRVFIERIMRRLRDGWPTAAEDITDNEVLLYVYGAISLVITATVKENYALVGVHEGSDGFITTFRYALSTGTKDPDTGDLIVTLPHPPINVPYSVKAPYFTFQGRRVLPLIGIESHAIGYAMQMPCPDFGAYYIIEGNKMILISPKKDLKTSGWSVSIPMYSPRTATTGNLDAVMNVPEDSLEQVFDIVVKKLTDRVANPSDLTNDGVKDN